MVSNNMLYLVTEHASNGELFEFLAEHGRMEEPEAQRIFWQIVLAVEYCHQQGVVHRDLKVENLLFDAYWDIKIADFGFSNTYVQGKLLDTWCGSPPYAAPEIFQGLNYNGEKLDIWSMGVILYVLVCGCLPFDGDSLQELRSRVLSGRYRIPYFLSRNCESLIQRILVLDPVKRYTVQQIKQHVWMRRDAEYDIYNGCGATSTRGADILPLNDNVLQAMTKLGLDQEKTETSVKEQKYDHYYAIYHLLLEKVETSGPISLNIKQPSQMPNLSSSCDSVSVTSSISLDQKYTEAIDRGLLRQKSCSPKGSIGTPSIDEGFSSDVSFDADQSIGKESSMEQMTPIKEDPEAEHLRLSSTSSSASSATTPKNTAGSRTPAQLDFEISWQPHHFSHLKLPANQTTVAPPMPPMLITTEPTPNVPSDCATNAAPGTHSSSSSSSNNAAALTSSTASSVSATHLHSSYDEVSGEKMLVNLGGHSNFSSLESQCSEYSSNISLDASQQHLHHCPAGGTAGGGGSGGGSSLSPGTTTTSSSSSSSGCNRFTQSTSLSPQVCVARPPLVHQQRIGDCFSGTTTNNGGGTNAAGFLACGRRASESNLNEQDQEELEPNPKNMKHSVQPYTIQTLAHFESSMHEQPEIAGGGIKLLNQSAKQPTGPCCIVSTAASSNSLNVAVVSSAPGSPSVQTKRLIKQRTVAPRSMQQGNELSSRLSPNSNKMLHPPSISGSASTTTSPQSPPLLHHTNPHQPASQQQQSVSTGGGSHSSPTQFLSPLAISSENFNKSLQYHHQHPPSSTSLYGASASQRSNLSHHQHHPHAPLFSKHHQLQFQSAQPHLCAISNPGSSVQLLGPTSGVAGSGNYTFMGASKCSFLPKPHSFDETQSHNRLAGVASSSGDVCCSGVGVGSGAAGVGLMASDVACRRQHSFDTPSKLHNQSSTEEQSSEESSSPQMTHSTNSAMAATAASGLLTTSSGAAVKERMMKSQRRISSSPYAMKQSQSQHRSPSLRGVPRNGMQRQETLRPRHILERQDSKCSSSPPRSPLTHHSSLDNESGTGQSGFNQSGGILSQSLALSPGVSNVNVGNTEITCMLQQMELGISASSPLSSNPAVSSTSLSDTGTSHSQKQLQFHGSKIMHADMGSLQGFRFTHNAVLQRHQASPPIPSISFESAEGIVHYLDNANPRARSPTALAASASTYSLGAGEDRRRSPPLPKHHIHPQSNAALQPGLESPSHQFSASTARDQKGTTFSYSYPNAISMTVNNASVQQFNQGSAQATTAPDDAMVAVVSNGNTHSEVKQDQLSQVPNEFVKQMCYVASAAAVIGSSTEGRRSMESQANSEEPSQSSSPMDQE